MDHAGAASRWCSRHARAVARPRNMSVDSLDLHLLEALKSPASCVGARGSLGNTAKRKERLAMFDVSVAEIANLPAPVGLDIIARTPPEIAVGS